MEVGHDSEVIFFLPCQKLKKFYLVLYRYISINILYIINIIYVMITYYVANPRVIFRTRAVKRYFYFKIIDEQKVGFKFTHALRF